MIFSPFRGQYHSLFAVLVVHAFGTVHYRGLANDGKILLLPTGMMPDSTPNAKTDGSRIPDALRQCEGARKHSVLHAPFAVARTAT
jgi:hypothetical protein